MASVDGTGMVILDAVDVAYSAALVHSASSASVACSALYDTSSKRHKGVCNLQGLEAGGFELKVQLGSDLIGGGTYHITVDGCTDTFELSDDGLSCTCPAGRYELGNVCAECADGTHKPAPGTERADCIACVAPQTSNAARTACDACISGYYRKGVSCAPCPNGKQCTTTSDRGALTLAPGYWRGFGESTKVLACRFEITSCPGDKNAATSVVAPDPYCAPGFVGPLCSECETSYFLTWAGPEPECRLCGETREWFPTIITGAVLVSCIGLVAGVCVKTGLKAKVLRWYKTGKTKWIVIVQICQV